MRTTSVDLVGIFPFLSRNPLSRNVQSPSRLFPSSLSEILQLIRVLGLSALLVSSVGLLDLLLLIL